MAYVSIWLNWHSILPFPPTIIFAFYYRIDNDGNDLLSMLLQVKEHCCVQIIIWTCVYLQLWINSQQSCLCSFSLRQRSEYRLRTLSDTHIFEVLEIRFRHLLTVSTHSPTVGHTHVVYTHCLTNSSVITLAASIFSFKDIQLQKDPGKRSSVYPESSKSSRVDEQRGRKKVDNEELPVGI